MYRELVLDAYEQIPRLLPSRVARSASRHLILTEVFPLFPLFSSRSGSSQLDVGNGLLSREASLAVLSASSAEVDAAASAEQLDQSLKSVAYGGVRSFLHFPSPHDSIPSFLPSPPYEYLPRHLNAWCCAAISFKA